MTTIALLEDESTLREEIADFLTSRGHRVRQAGTLARRRRAAQPCPRWKPCCSRRFPCWITALSG